MSLPTLDILICTIADRINNISANLPPQTEGINYIISHQTDGTSFCCPAELKARNDVVVVTLEGRGLSKNRNNAIVHATGDLMVISDDDASYNISQLQQIRKVAKNNPQADVMTFMVKTRNGDDLHRYPSKSFTYPNRPKGFYYNSNEIVLRNGRNYPLFDHRLGLGSDRLHMGEEEYFIYCCYKKNLRIEFHPVVIQTIPDSTTSTHYASSQSLQMSKGAVLTLIHGSVMAIPRIVYTALIMRNTIPFWKHLRNLFKGLHYIKTTKPNS